MSLDLFYSLHKIRQSVYNGFLPFKQTIYLRKQSKALAQFIEASVVCLKAVKIEMKRSDLKEKNVQLWS